jgi:hypothetical protein
MNEWEKFKKFMEDETEMSWDELLEDIGEWGDSEVGREDEGSLLNYFQKVVEEPELFVAKEMSILRKIHSDVDTISSGDELFTASECRHLLYYGNVIILEVGGVNVLERLSIIKSEEKFNEWVKQTMAKWRKLLTMYNLLYGADER